MVREVTRSYKAHKGLTKRNLRDNMTNVEQALNTLAEAATTELSKEIKRGLFHIVITGAVVLKCYTSHIISPKSDEKLVSITSSVTMQPALLYCVVSTLFLDPIS